MSVIEERRKLLVLDASTNTTDQRDFCGWTVPGIPLSFSKTGYLQCVGLCSLVPSHSE